MYSVLILYVYILQNDRPIALLANTSILTLNYPFSFVVKIFEICFGSRTTAKACKGTVCKQCH